ncbi:glycosyltransferase family 4 protein [Bradyrhizobium sp. AZCC 2230]|uniref:glycosyltransferase family 4 protein n=1 Tax=Bradyrhizobium sp. AZCC 2230 TaxID=3117021 RepID=UPI002FF0D8EF
MRITFLIPNLGLAGGNRVVAIYAERLKRLGHHVRVVSGPQWKPSLSQKLKSFLKGRGWLSGPDASQPYFEDLGVEVSVLADARPISDEDVPDADVVIATWWETAEWVSKLSPVKGAKAYFIQHHEVFPYLPLERCRATYRLPLRKIVISRWLKETMERVYDDHSSHLIFNSVNTDQFFAPARVRQSIPTLGFLYSTVDFKDPQALLDSLHEVKKRVPELRAVAFGAHSVSSFYPLPEWVEFHHQPKQNDIRLLYARCDVWLCASKSEGFHLPPLEAMACRCPVVSTRVGGPIDIIEDGVNGYLADVGDVEALADRVVKVLGQSDASWQLMSDAAFATALRYTWDDATRLFEEAVREISEN